MDFFTTIENRIFLDLDNVFSLENPNSEFVEIPIENFPKPWKIKVEYLKFFEDLSKLKNTKVYWITGWQEKANAINDYLKIPHFTPSQEKFKIRTYSNDSKLRKEQLEIASRKFKKNGLISIDSELEEGLTFHFKPNDSQGLPKESLEIILDLLR